MFCLFRLSTTLRELWVAALIPVVIRVLGVEHPYELNSLREEGHKTKLIPI